MHIHEDGLSIDATTLECIALSDDDKCTMYALSVCGPDIRSEIVNPYVINACVALIGADSYLKDLDLCDHVADDSPSFRYLCKLGHKPSILEYEAALEYEQIRAFNTICVYGDTNKLRMKSSDCVIAVMEPFLKLAHSFGFYITEHMYQVATDSDFWECADFIHKTYPLYTAVVGNNTDSDIYTTGYLITKRDMGCTFNDNVCSLACKNHDLDALMYAHKNGAKIGNAMRVAANYDSFVCMKYIALHGD
jgi:hypothetical protein